MNRPISLKILMNIRVAESPLRSAVIAAAGRRIALFVKQLGNAFRHRRQIAILAKLDDRTLVDVGLSRSDVQDAMSQPFWVRTNGKPLEPRRWRRGGNPSLDALARLDDAQSYNLSETGQCLRREARRPH
jgi:uncharacterized protein YjiS (DUF1127 family)